MGKATRRAGTSPPARRGAGVAAQQLRGVSVAVAAAMVTAELARRQTLSAQTEVRAFGLINRFVSFVTLGCGFESLSEVSAEHVSAFVASATVRGGDRPSVATMRLRRWALRLFFRVARDLRLTNGDATLDVMLPGRTARSVRPLSDAEVERCRRAALRDLSTTRLSMAWALGEATARTAEISHVCVDDVDLANGRVWIHGSPHTTPRWGDLTTWGATQVGRRLREVKCQSDPRTRLAESGGRTRESRVSFSSQTLRETLTRAGLANQDRVGPASVAGWAGVQVFTGTGRIDAVARALGLRSLDGAARLLDWDWTSDDAHAHG
jgi:integrase